MKKYSIELGFCIFLSCIFGSTQLNAQDQASKGTIVEAYEVEKRLIQSVYELNAQVRAKESVVITPPVAERVKSFFFTDNQFVKAGEPLVALDDAEEKAQLESERSLNIDAQQQVDRLVPLVRKGAAPQAVLDTARANLKNSKAQMDLIQATIDLRLIKAPFDGVLGISTLSEGVFLNAGQPIVTLFDTSSYELLMDFPIAVHQKLKQAIEDDQFSVAVTHPEFPQSQKNLELKVASKDLSVQHETQTIRLKALIEDNIEHWSLVHGLSLPLEVQFNQREMIMVPEESLIFDGNSASVYCISEESKAMACPIEFGVRQKGYVEVLSGLDQSDLIIRKGWHKVKPGQKVNHDAH